MDRTVFLHLVTSLSYRPESSSITRIATSLFLTIVCNATNRIQYNKWSVKKLIQSNVSINPSITIHDMGENSTIILSPSLSVSRWHTIWQACHCLIRTCMSFIAFHPSSTEDMGIYLCSPGSKSWSKISSVSFSYLIASKVMLMLFCKSKPKYYSTCINLYDGLLSFLSNIFFLQKTVRGNNEKIIHRIVRFDRIDKRENKCITSVQSKKFCHRLV